MAYLLDLFDYSDSKNLIPRHGSHGEKKGTEGEMDALRTLLALKRTL